MGKLIAFEGLDGSGKTTLSKLLVSKLCDLGYSALWTREPTNQSPAGQRLRELLDSGQEIPEEEQLELFMSDRHWHTEHVLKPRLDDHDFVVTDRYFISTAAYQSKTREEFEKILNRCHQEFIVPNLWVHVDVPVSVAMERVSGRGRQTSMETEAKLRHVYDMLKPSLFGEAKIDAWRPRAYRAVAYGPTSPDYWVHCMIPWVLRPAC